MVTCVLRGYSQIEHELRYVFSSPQIRCDTDGHEQVVGRDMSCYSCDFCLTGEDSQCSNRATTGDFRRLYTDDDTVELEEYDAYIGRETDLIEEGMVVAVITEDPADDYYLIEVTKAPYTLRKETTDAWGAHFEIGAHVIKGNYYEQIDNGFQYRKIRGKPAIVHTQAYAYNFGKNDSSTFLMLEEDHLNTLTRIQELYGYI